MAEVNNTRPMPTVGVDRYTFFKLLTDDTAGATYDAGVELPGTVEIAATDSGGSDVFDADNGAYCSDSYLENIGHDITNADIPPEVDAAWRGLEIKNGMLEVGDVAQAPYFGVAWRIQKAGGAVRYVKYYKGTYGFASSVGGKTRPSKGASEKQTAKATYTAVKRQNDGMYYAYVDSDKLPEGVTQDTVEEKWFTDITWSPAVTPQS